METITQYLEARPISVSYTGIKKQQWERSELSFGDVNIADFVYMYKKCKFHNQSEPGFEQLTKPLSKNYDTEATWLRLPEMWSDSTAISYSRTETVIM